MIPKLKYCDKRIGNGKAHCSCVATYQVKLCSKGDNDIIKIKSELGYRCNEHKTSSTVNKKVYEYHTLDQSYELQKVNEFLRSLLGKLINSKWQRESGLEVKYLKENGGVMCQHHITKKWKYVYSHEIVLP